MNKYALVSHKRYGQLVRESLWLLSVGVCFIGTAVFGAAPGSTDDQLDKLENKLFQHTYDKDSPDDRLNRLENLIFGQSEKGSTDERVTALVKAVPNLDSNQAPGNTTDSSQSDQRTEAGNELSQPRPYSDAKDHAAKNHNTSNQDTADNDKNNSEQSKYPAVSAMETKLLGKDYANDPLKERLARLEKKVLGQVSTSDDLSDRVDRLKQATGIDVAKTSGSMSDWLEDNDDMLMQQPMSSNRPSTSDIYQDMQRSASGNSSDYPFNSPYFPDQPSHAPVSIKSFGLSQQVSALEHEIFHKTYEHDPLPARLNRLETTVFPDQKPAVDKPLPERVNNLLAKVPISQKELQNLAVINGIDTKGGFDQSASNNSNSTMANAGNKQPSGLGKLMNSIGSMLGGGMVGGYPTNGGNYMVDPKTGMMIDPTTGTVINPNTGTVYGARPYYPGYSPYGASPYGMNPYGGMGGFGMSPFGSPYGMGSGFGFGNGGMGFGFR